MSLLLFSMILKPFFLGLLSWGSILLALPAFGEISQAVQIDHGRLIYLEGKLPSGNPIIGISSKKFVTLFCAVDSCHQTPKQFEIEKR